MSKIPFGKQTYYSVLTPTQYSINLLNPYHPMAYMAITVNFPVLPDYTIEEEQPELTLNDFFSFVPAFREHLDKGIDSILYSTFVAYRDIAVRIIKFNVIKDDGLWKQLVSLYLAHELTLVIRDLKDEANLTSFEGENNELNYHIKELDKTERNVFYLTPYGFRFWQRYDPIAKMDIIGSRTSRRVR